MSRAQKRISKEESARRKAKLAARAEFLQQSVVGEPKPQSPRERAVLQTVCEKRVGDIRASYRSYHPAKDGLGNAPDDIKPTDDVPSVPQQKKSDGE